MKVKATKGLNNATANSVSCSGLEFNQLQDGKTVELIKEVADEMIANGWVILTKQKEKKDGNK